MENQLGIERIWQQDGKTLAIKWTDGDEKLYDVVELRRKCPCAECKDEWTHQPKLRPEQVAEDVRPLRVNSVGRYALGIFFNDGHSTGIYSYSYLKSL